MSQATIIDEIRPKINDDRFKLPGCAGLNAIPWNQELAIAKEAPGNRPTKILHAI